MWYTSILEEHKTVRNAAGMFDVSDMGRVWVTGDRAGAFLSEVLTKNAEQLRVGSAQLSLMCLEDGGILDGLLIYRLDIGEYLIVWNAGNAGTIASYSAFRNQPSPYHKALIKASSVYSSSDGQES